MSGQMYAGYLCGTQIGGRINIEGGSCDTPESPALVVIVHGGTTAFAHGSKPHSKNRGNYHGTVKVVLRHPPTGAQTHHVIEGDAIVTVEDPS